MAWRLKYGAGTMGLESGEHSGRNLASPAITPLLDPTQAVRDALDAPTGSSRLRDLAAGARHVLIVVPHSSLPAGLPLMLPQILDVLQDSGVGLRQVEIVVAAGWDRHLEADEMEALVGAEVWNRVVVRQHDPADTAGFEDMGETERGTPLLLNRKASVGGQLLILAGAFAPDPVMGFQGGPGLVLPGLSATASIQAHQKLALSDSGKLNPACRAGEVDDNPIFQDALEAADKLEPDFLVHSVIDDEGRMVKVVAGDWRKATDLGCDWVRARLKVTVQEPRAWAIAGAGGAPFDRTLESSAGGLLEAARCVRDGGVLIFASQCAGGVGAEAFQAAGTGTARAFAQKLSQSPMPGGLAALALKAQAERIRIRLISSLPADVVTGLGMQPAESFEAAWPEITAAHNDEVAGYILPSAGRTVVDAAWQRESLPEERPVVS